MADTLRQESKGGVNKVLLGVSIVIVALNVLLFCLVPKNKTIAYEGEAVVYFVQDEDASAAREVFIDGVLMQSVFLEDTFEGTFYVSDVPGLTKELTLHLTREDGAWRGGFLDAEGNAAETGILTIAATKDFEKITLALEDDALADGEAAFLALDAPNRTYALRQYQELIAGVNP